MVEEKKTEELTAEIERDIEDMFRFLEVLDGGMKSYTGDPENYPRPDHERYNDMVLNYERFHSDGWSNDLRFRYNRLLEKRACYEDTWVRWCEYAGLEYLKAGRKI